jgi:chromosome partitioning protein
MSAVVTVMNMKGGVGKTTVCAHLGQMLARRKISNAFKRVLLIDYDPQFNLSQAYLRSKRYFELERAHQTCLQILQDPSTALDPFQIQTPTTTVPPSVSVLAESVAKSSTGMLLDLIPSTLNLMYVALGTSTGNTEIVEERFKAFIGQCRQQYDLVIIDCHPAGSILTRTSLHNSDHVLIPVAPQAYAARGVALMAKFIDANRAGTAMPTAHVLFNLTPRTGLPSQAEVQIRTQYPDLCLTQTLHKYKVFSEPQEGRGFVFGSGKPYSTEAYANLRKVAEEFAARIKLR